MWPRKFRGLLPKRNGGDGVATKLARGPFGGVTRTAISSISGICIIADRCWLSSIQSFKPGL